MEEFNLSDKRIKRNFSETYMYDEKDVKEFIKKLKRETFELTGSYELHWFIDKLAGEKLK